MKEKQPESARSTFNSLSSHNRRGAILAIFLASLLALACGTAHGDTYSLLDPSTLSAWASTVGNNDRPALYAVNGAGMNDDGTHHASDAANYKMWMAGNGSIKTTSPARFVVTFAESVSLAGIKFWNFNWVNYANRGAKDIEIYCTADATAFSTEPQTSVDDITNNWTAVKTDYVLPQASGTPTYAGDNMITFGPFEAKYVAILVKSTYDGGYGGLSEVRFYESSDAPMLDDISLTRTGAATYSLSATVLANTADTLSWIADDGASTPVTNAFATAVAEGVTETVTISGLAADKTYKISVLAENSSGSVERTAGIIYTGTLAFGAATDAKEAGLVSGGVVISRATSADSWALDIDYTITGSAGTEGTTWAAPGTVTIPAGETSATLPVKPLIDVSVTEDVAITVALASGNYEVPAAPATLTLVNAESLVAGFACDDFSGYTATASISGKSPSKTGFASSAWTEDYNWPLKVQSTDLGFPEFLARTNLVGSVVRSKGYKTSAKRELDVTTVPYTGTFYYRFVFRQSEPGEGYTWCNQNSYHHTGNTLGFSATSTVSQDFYKIFGSHKTIGAGPMPNAANSAIGIYLRTGWDKRTELVAPADYEYATDYLVCVEVTLSDSGKETFRAFAVKVADFTKSMISAPPWIDCTACSIDIVSGATPFKWVTFATHASSDENATIVFDEFAMGPTLKDIFQPVAKPFVIIIR